MPTNSSSFAYGIIKSSWIKVGSDISTSLEMIGVQSWGIDFFLFLCSEVKEKINASTLKTCHFKDSGDITIYFGSETLNDTISKWPRVGRHDWPPCMISDNFKKALFVICLLYGAYRNITKGVHDSSTIASIDLTVMLIWDPAFWKCRTCLIPHFRSWTANSWAIFQYKSTPEVWHEPWSGFNDFSFIWKFLSHSRFKIWTWWVMRQVQPFQRKPNLILTKSQLERNHLTLYISLCTCQKSPYNLWMIRCYTKCISWQF